jgi:anti-sigma regulatory factor (Ser/Thr protein kinase)
MQDLSLHILDVAENGVKAGADLIKISVEEDLTKDLMTIAIEDNGQGMAPEFLARVFDPFVTTRTTRKVGLGLSLLQQAAWEAEGDVTIRSVPGRGATVNAVMKRSHIDRKPMGDMCETLATLIEGNPRIDFIYSHSKEGKEYTLDTRELRAELEEVPLNNPEVVRWVRNNIKAGLEELAVE